MAAVVVRWAMILVLCLSGSVAAALQTGGDHARQVLLLLSYDPLYPMASDIVRTLRNALSQPVQQPLQFHVEFMDAEFNQGADYLEAYRHLLRTKHDNGERYDLVITAGEAALKLAMEGDAPLFGDIPVICFGIGDPALIRSLRSRGGLTGIHESLPVYEYFALMRFMYPGLDNLYVIRDGLSGYDDVLTQLAQASESLNQRITYLSLADMSWGELSAQLAELHEQPVLLISAREDKAGERRDFSQAVQYLSLSSGVPLWHLWQNGIGSGLAGGVVTDLERSAERVAVMARSILSGVPVNDINVEWHGDFLTLADAQVLAQYGIGEDDLPQNVDWLNAEPDFWAAYRGQFLLALSLIIFTATVGVFLWTEVRRRQLSDEQLNERTSLIQNILNSIPDMMFYKDVNGRYIFSNRKFNEFFGKNPVGGTDYDIFDKETADFFRQKDGEAVGRKNANVNEEWVHGVDGTVMLLETQKTPIYDKGGNIVGVFGLSRDITELKKAQENLEHIAHHDVLTGLPNRLLLNKKLEYALQISRRAGEAVAVIFLDLDRFKDINDTIGHDIGDLLLKDVAHRLHNNVRDSDICARLGGDEFVVVLTRIEKSDKVHEKCEQLLQIISRPYSLQGHLLSVFASAGIAVYPDDGVNVDELIRNADAALHKAKELGRNRFYHYHRELTDTIHSRMSLEQDLRSALEDHAFTLNYQPQFRTGEVHPRRVEALLRWPHPVRGMISPHDFIPLAETSGMITELGFWVLKSACQQFMFWRQQGLMLEKLAVNVSAIQINATFADTVASILQHLEFDPHWLELEVTESLMMSGTTEVTHQVQQLRSMGVEFAIDDFGTGYSSLSKLKSMPVSVIKVDQSFVRDINDDVNDYEIVRAIILMAKSLGLIVVAEGVEHEEQVDTLRRIGCDWLQGYYFARPMDGDSFYKRYSHSDS
ncbi:EAL domain-containing protein [Thalassolituus sp. LLYu03]|uniref:EAL domain-containing protein n=1 Tax=Thalassolituus sp. LLYu03 TaxID=3421656 RepID=UPI003D2C815B